MAVIQLSSLCSKCTAHQFSLARGHAQTQQHREACTRTGTSGEISSRSAYPKCMHRPRASLASVVHLQGGALCLGTGRLGMGASTWVSAALGVMPSVLLSPWKTIAGPEAALARRKDRWIVKCCSRYPDAL